MDKQTLTIGAALAGCAMTSIAGSFASSPWLLVPSIACGLAGCYALRLMHRRQAQDAQRITMLEKRFGCDSMDVYFSHLVRGGYYRTEQDRIREGEPLGFSFSAKRYVVLVAHLEQWGQTFAQGGEPMQAEAVRHTFFVLRNVFSDLLNEKNQQYNAEVDGEHVSIVCVQQEDTQALYQELRQCAQRAVEFLEEEFGISITVAISEYVENLGQLPQAYAQCQQILELRRLCEDDVQVSMLGDFGAEILSTSPIRFARLETQLLSLCRIGDYGSAREALRTICADETARIADQYTPSLRFRLFGVTHTLLSVLEELKPTINAELYASLQLPQALLACQSFTELLQAADLIFDRIPQLSEVERRDPIPNWVMAMREYIDENYKDPNLSVYAASEKFSISPSHCSRVFKQHVGVGALEYIQRKRMEYAKSLMLQNISVKQVAEESGFSNTLMMNRAFKRYAGVTPSKFRENEAEA